MQSRIPLESRLLHFNGFLLPTLLTALIVLSVLNLAHSVYRSTMTDGGVDLHPYWHYGHYVRYGMNPYTAFAHGTPLPDPVRYIDGSEIPPGQVPQPHKAQVPAQIASTILVTALLSYLPWYPALYTWFVIDLGLLIAIPWLTMRLLPSSLRLTSGLQWLIAFSFYASKGFRIALVNGQPSILVFFMMIVTLLLRRSHWIWAGVALGMALGKYSLSLPVVIFLLLEKRFRVLFVGALVQVISLIAVSSLKGGSIWETVQVYWEMLAFHAVGQSGIHLSYSFSEFPELTRVFVVVGTVITVAMLVYCYRRGLCEADVLPINSLLCLWTLLAAYHRNYDTTVGILFLVFCLSAITTWKLPTRQTQLLTIFWLLSLIGLCLPGEMAKNFFPVEQAEIVIRWVGVVISAMLVAMWGVNLWLIPRVPRVSS